MRRRSVETEEEEEEEEEKELTSKLAECREERRTEWCSSTQVH